MVSANPTNSAASTRRCASAVAADPQVGYGVTVNIGELLEG
jgi:hypothetical protein